MQKRQHQISRKKAWLEKPFKLTVGEMKAPTSVIKGFFMTYDLPAIHDHFSLLLNNVPNNISAFLDALEFIDNVEKLVEANHFLLRKNS
ncbi:hypothetical protein SAMN05660461_4325 [Chitinophaga ginsengisegetis]|uniref:Uncharacterized protein n=1 Tax=Chitinophaga ginsengisegetis TaxID=393003 RepID=A0A1T5P6V8_9BACT|nr:hypothetical protein [Chitinophaga ginsengisegetis]SKD08441.1 hypothetical protein SAMN05660461_4325 [Chitinophaga ginsengisegetis]